MTSDEPKKRKRLVEIEPEELTSGSTLDVASLREEVDKLLQFSAFEPEHEYSLDMGPELNGVLGSRKHGIPYGKLYELAGMEHGGKTAVSTILAGRAQKEGAAVGHIDLERSRDPIWAAKLGLDYSKVVPVYAKLMQEKKAKLAHLQGAEELFAEMEVMMDLLRQKGFKKQFWFLDSVAMIATKRAIEAGAIGQNMNTRTNRSVILSETLPRWAGLAANYNAMIVLINQMRFKPGVMFGDPSYSPGGKALDHAISVRARIRRLKNGQMLKNGRVVGLIGIIKNIKNKAGHGSSERRDCGFSIRWDRPVADVNFMTADEAEELLKG